MMTQLDLTVWVDRLKANAPVFGMRVFKTVPDSDLQIDEHESPCAFVYIAKDRSSSNTTIGGIRQELESSVVVEYVVRRTATRMDKFSTADSEVLAICKAQCRDALIGMRETGYQHPVLHSDGELFKKDKRALRFTDTFIAQQFLTKRLPA